MLKGSFVGYLEVIPEWKLLEERQITFRDLFTGRPFKILISIKKGGLSESRYLICLRFEDKEKKTTTVEVSFPAAKLYWEFRDSISKATRAYTRAGSTFYSRNIGCLDYGPYLTIYKAFYGIGFNVFKFTVEHRFYHDESSLSRIVKEEAPLDFNPDVLYRFMIPNNEARKLGDIVHELATKHCSESYLLEYDHI